MAVLSSQVERDSDVFARRRERMVALVSELRDRTVQVARGGGERALERHRSRGKLTARERIDRLCDPDTAFLELSALAQALQWSASPSAGGTGSSGSLSGTSTVAASGTLSNVVTMNYSQQIGALEQLTTGSVYGLTVTLTVSST